MEPGLVALVDGLLDAMAGKRDVDLIEDFAASIPIEIIGNLLGVPHDRARAAARLVARDPGRARAGAHARARGRRQRRRARDARLSRHAGRRAPRAPRDPDTDVLTRLIQGEGATTDRRRAPHRNRAAAPVHLPAQRRPRDDDQPHRQRAARADRMAGRESAPDRESRGAGRGQVGGRGIPALRELQPARQPDHDARRRGRRRRAAAGLADHDVHRRAPTATRRSFPTRTASTSRASPTATSRSASASTPAPA